MLASGAEMTNKGAAKAALERLDGTKAKQVGAIPIKVDLHRNSYHYWQYQRRSYAEYSQAAGGR